MESARECNYFDADDAAAAAGGNDTPDVDAHRLGNR